MSEAVPCVLGHKAHRGHWARAEEAHSFHETAAALLRSVWTRIARRVTDGHTTRRGGPLS